MVASASRPTIDTCRSYWSQGSRDFLGLWPNPDSTTDAVLMACRFGYQPFPQCMSDRLGYCKARILAALNTQLSKPLDELEAQVLWYAVFGRALKAHNHAVNASFLQWLLTNPIPSHLIHANGVRITDIKIKGDLKLDSTIINRPISIENSTFYGRIILTNAEVRDISFKGSQCNSLEAERIKIYGSLRLSDGFRARRGAHLSNARVSGNLDCGGGYFNIGNRNHKRALTINRADVEGGVFLNRRFMAEGEVCLKGAQIAGNLDCSGGIFKNKAGPRSVGPEEVYAINSSLAKIHGDVLFSFIADDECRFTTHGHILAIGMTIDGNFDCTYGSIDNRAGNYHAISVDHSVISGCVFLRNGFTARGQVRLIGAHISGDLDCSGGAFLINEDRVNEDVKEKVAPEGEDEEVAIEARNADINGCVYLTGSIPPCRFGRNKSFLTDGGINFDFAHIGCDLIIGKSDYNMEGRSGPGKEEFSLPNINEEAGDSIDKTSKIAKRAIFYNRFRSHGSRVDIRNAKIDGSLRCVENLYDVRLSLDNTNVSGFITTANQKWWPKPGGFFRRNFVYKYISFRDNDDDDCKNVDYLEWLKREGKNSTRTDEGQKQKRADQKQDELNLVMYEHINTAFRPQPFEQLVKALRTMGYSKYADKIALSKRFYAWKAKPWSLSAFPGKVLERVFASWFVGYGYRIGRALVILLLLGMGFGCFYQQAFEQGTIVPSDRDIRKEVATDCNNLPAPACPALVGKLVSFNPWIYSADVMIPVIGLGQKSAWRPAYNDQLVNNVQLAETVLGWVGGLLLVSFVSGLIKKE